MQAKLGDRVHYVCPKNHVDRSARVSEVTEDIVTLHVDRPPSSPQYAEHGHTYVVEKVKYCPDKTPGTWHLPE